MDLLSLLRTLGGLGVVLGILAGALWLVRRFDLRLPGRTIGAGVRRLELVETLSIDGRRMVALVRRDGREHLVLIAPEGHVILENAIVRDAADDAADAERRAAAAEAAQVRSEQRERQRAAASAAIGAQSANFAALVDRANGGAIAAAGAKAWRIIRDRLTLSASGIGKRITTAHAKARARITELTRAPDPVDRATPPPVPAMPAVPGALRPRNAPRAPQVPGRARLGTKRPHAPSARQSNGKQQHA